MAFGSGLVAAFLAYSLFGALGVLISGLAQARVVHGAEKPASREASGARGMLRSPG